MQNFKSIAIFIAKSQSIVISIAKFQKYCNTLQYYWNHPEESVQQEIIIHQENAIYNRRENIKRDNQATSKKTLVSTS